MRTLHKNVYRDRKGLPALTKAREQAGFTLLELLVVIAILLVLIVAILAYLSYSRKRAIDVSTKQTLSDVRTTVAQESLGQPANAFATGTKAKADLDTLATKLGYTSADNTTAYEYKADTTGFAAVFPLQAGPTPYWCVDAEGMSVGTTGLLSATGTPSCATATRNPSTPTVLPDLAVTNSGPVTLTGVGGTASLSITLTEVAGGATSGTVSIRLVTIAGIAYTLQNSPDWSISPSGGFYTIISSAPGFSIASHGTSTITVLLTKSSTNCSSGSISIRLNNGSGGDSNNANNISSTGITQNDPSCLGT